MEFTLSESPTWTYETFEINTEGIEPLPKSYLTKEEVAFFGILQENQSQIYEGD